MSDLIDRQQAIDALDKHIDTFDAIDTNYLCGLRTAMSILKEMPSAQPETHDKRTETHACDLISRKMAIDAVVSAMIDGADAELVEGVMELLPSAQPEIIRCTECKHYREYDSKYVENAVVVQCMADRYPISEIIPDGWLCAGAERKDDE